MYFTYVDYLHVCVGVVQPHCFGDSILLYIAFVVTDQITCIANAYRQIEQPMTSIIAHVVSIVRSRQVYEVVAQ